MAFSGNPLLTTFNSQLVQVQKFRARMNYILSNINMPLGNAENLSNAQDPTSMAATEEFDCLIRDDFRKRHGKILEESKRLFKKASEDPLQSLIVMDALQRLGIDYHFRNDIEAVLWSQYDTWCASSDHHNLDLFEVALRFRLLRQQGCQVSADVFNTFMNHEGQFKQSLAGDIKGLMALYEASQLSMEGENILDEAKDFSSHHLNAKLPHLNQHEAKIVTHTLKHPYHRSFTRFIVRDYINNFQGANEYLDTFIQLAKLDFNAIQSLNQEEIVQISKWWKELGLTKELKFVRDQPLKWYMWTMISLTDPRLSEQRVELVKPISLVYIIDDVFDLSGTLDELILFTEAVDRWEIAASEKLPDYMKICFKALYDITNEIGFQVHKNLGWNPISYLRKAWGKLCNAFLVEAKWFDSGKMPKAEEYLKNGIISSGVPLVIVHIFFISSECITKESADLVINDTRGFISSIAKILRLWDDLGSAKDEYQEGHDGSYVECYMRERPGLSVEEAREHVMHMISDTWKQLNRQCLSQNPFSPTFIDGLLNVARTVPLMYNYGHNQNLPSPEDLMESLLFQNIS